MDSRCGLLRLNTHFAFYRTLDSQNWIRKPQLISPSSSFFLFIHLEMALFSSLLLFLVLLPTLFLR